MWSGIWLIDTKHVLIVGIARGVSFLPLSFGYSAISGARTTELKGKVTQAGRSASASCANPTGGQKDACLRRSDSEIRIAITHEWQASC